MSPANTWAPCLEGATIRNVYPGRSGFQGVLAAHLVRCGFTGVNDGPKDLYTAILGDGFDPEAVVDGLGEPAGYRIQLNYFKFIACCLYNHPVLDALQAMTQREAFEGADVAGVHVDAPPVGATLADPEPKNMLAAKFSIPYAVAASLVHGSTDITAFYPDRVADPRIKALAQKVELEADPKMNLRSYDYPAARVTVSLKDGRVIEESVMTQYGDTRNPASTEELTGKFTFLAQEVLGQERTQQVIKTVGNLDTLKDLKDLTGLLGKG